MGDPICGARFGSSVIQCQREPGHSFRHRCDDLTWGPTAPSIQPIPDHVVAFAAGLITFAPAAVSARRPGGVPAAVADAVAHMGLGTFDPAELATAAAAWIQRCWGVLPSASLAAPPRSRTWAPCGRCGCGALSHAGGAAGACLTVGCECESFA